MTPGYVWAPGYWAWHEDRHIWIRGRTIYQRSGYRWEPDGWEQQGARYIQRPGRWEPIYVQAPMNHGQAKKKHDRKDKRSKGDDNEQGNGKGRDKRESK